MKIAAIIAFAAMTAFAGGAALAHTAKPAGPAVAAPAKPVVAAPAAVAPAATGDAKKLKSKECSAKADTQKLHGKARKKFREECKKAA